LTQHGAPDILCTQETRGKFYRLLAEKMGYTHTFNLKKGTVILSKYPMEAGGDIPFGATANSTLWVDIRVGNDLIRVYSVHLQSNKVSVDTEKVLEEADEVGHEHTLRGINRVVGKVGRATAVRAEQALRLREHVLKSPHPFLLCGDLNDTPTSYVYALLADGLCDTFREKGSGIGTTFGGVLPMLRIDYILTDPAFKTYTCRTVRGPYSDHYPVFAEMKLK
jgi:endonuclease/exonuclease/phosphatase family metal-dependent hydrolase